MTSPVTLVRKHEFCGPKSTTRASERVSAREFGSRQGPQETHFDFWRSRLSDFRRILTDQLD